MSVQEFEIIMKNRPHVVLLGAGASVAAIPNGDKNQRKTSVMAGFIEKLGMADIIQKANLKTKSNNLEDIYSELNSRKEYEDITLELERRIYDYFYSFEIPDEPTVYDFLILSLTRKDLIATFNWDPLLLQAYERVSKFTTNLPDLSFLHGNTYVGVCNEHKVGGLIHGRCSVCGKPFKPTKLLYPVKEKDYNNDPFIKDNWNRIRHYLKHAYMFTIFGYSAPKTDVSAIELLKEAWGTVEDRNLEEVEIIDIRPEKELRQTWDEFIHSHHYSIHPDFFSSTLGKMPRRSCEATFDRLMNAMWLDGNKGFKPDMNFNEIEVYIRRLLEDEKTNKKVLINPYLAK
ncbi:hypothetical protein [Alicyclobacillus acidoterrestris]|uniref:Uncharacterized protein n=1 Tax=Alicyclobacillus acidoterrestris (strain ATCC 49025 / DSM 3922 / CIP 106132 / NCIMB 13137 / GD3B) TaxID=1356854 RepID=T0CFM8_ALIAG|nr:hypothetical protein [Alicyclobacillus acidoterrestris]EPZ51619.1 hypothetical protein N007_20840 [Alicyclobacillus acidoterrestris ATCC 49025]UNO49367.1 hypothetical protein K1I37_02080 [Alicyclobacillus acidoterrestris]